MGNYKVELLICAGQLMTFYLLPPLLLRRDPIGMVLSMVILTLLLAMAMGFFSRHGIKYVYPAFAALAFLLSVVLFYQPATSVHVVWYLVVSVMGLVLGGMLSEFLHHD